MISLLSALQRRVQSRLFQRHRGLLGLFLAALLNLPVAGAQEPTPSSEPAHYENRRHLAEYHGPGRDGADPAGLEEVAIGYFGPSDPSHPTGGDAWLAAQLAVDRANQQGGYRGIPFVLIPGWSKNPWGSGISEVTRMVYQSHVWAIIGSINGASTHLAEQVVAKARVTLINPASPDKSVNLANVPWMFSCLPGDHRQAPVIYEALHHRLEANAFVVVSAIDHDSRVLEVELTKYLAQRGLGPLYHFEFDRASPQPFSFVTQLIESKAEAALIIAGAADSAAIIVKLREHTFGGLIFGGPELGRRLFLRNAGSHAEGVYFPLLVTLSEGGAFSDLFRKFSGHLPDYVGQQTFDAVNLLIDAIRLAGLNRARIRDAVRNLSPWMGVSGPIIWDPLGQNQRAVGLATVREGQIVRINPSDSPVP